MPTYRFRAVIFRQGEHWIAKCLEYGYVLQTRSRLEEVPGELRRILAMQIRLSLEFGIEPFAGFQPASRRFWEMYERGSLVEQSFEDGESGPEVEVRLSGSKLPG